MKKNNNKLSSRIKEISDKKLVIINKHPKTIKQFNEIFDVIRTTVEKFLYPLYPTDFMVAVGFAKKENIGKNKYNCDIYGDKLFLKTAKMISSKNYNKYYIEMFKQAIIQNKKEQDEKNKK